VDGILIIDKPEGLTSHDVVARVRRILKTKRVGHTGTLDPFATGVLVLLVGQATRLAQFLDKDEKEYEALVKFGYETDTGDREGVRSAECGMRSEEIEALVAQTDWASLLADFRGEIEQVPPMYSAKKIGGKKLYELARQGVEVERKAITVFIKELELLDPAEFRIPQSALRIRVVCSAGTYIRTLAEDIGKKLGTGAHLEELRRTRAGRFGISRAMRLDDLEALGDPRSALIPIVEAVEHLPKFIVRPERVEKVRNGLASRTAEPYAEGSPIRMLDETGNLVAVGFYDASENSVRPKIVLI